jgi:hypothetical protein
MHPYIIGGIEYVWTMTVTMTGEYSSINTGMSFFTVDASVDMTLHRSVSGSGNSCIPSGSFGDCAIGATGLTLSGVFSHPTGTMPTRTVGDTTTLTGGTAPGSLSVAGTGTNCGIILGANNGYLVVPGVSLVVI